MSQDVVVSLTTQALELALLVALPILLVALTVGLVVSVFQAMTQIQEFTLAFVPKVVGVGVALIISGNWMLHTLIDFTQDLFDRIPSLLG